MKRRDFINKAGLGIATGAVAASSLSTPAIAQSKKTITIVSMIFNYFNMTSFNHLIHHTN